MKTIKLLFSILFCTLVFQSYSQGINTLSTTFSIHNNSKTIQKIKLSEFNFELDKMIDRKEFYEIAPDKVRTFSYRFVEPTILSIGSDSIKDVRVAIEKNGPVTIYLDKIITLESEVANISNFQTTIQALNKKHFNDMIQKFDRALKENDKDMLTKLEKKKDSVLLEFTKDMEHAVRAMGASALAFDALQYFDMNKNHDFIEEIAARISAAFPNSQMSKALQKRMDFANRVAIGKEAMSFNVKNLEGLEIKLTNFIGKYVLIDFWATWCRPCRLENPKLVSLYEKFRDSGFEIVSISIDKDEILWKKAIENDGLYKHQQILDSSLSIYKLYSLSTLPSNFLLDNNGVIIAKNMDAKKLDTMLSLLIKKH